MAGVTVVLHVGTSFHRAIGYFMVDAATEEATNGAFKHCVYSSVFNTQLRKMMHHDCKRYVEVNLMESGLNFTILRPNHIMDRFPVVMILSQSEPMYRANWNTNIPLFFMTLQDLAEAAAKVIEERENELFGSVSAVLNSSTL